MKDSIVQEVRKARAELFAKAGHDLATLVKQLQKRQAVSNARSSSCPIATRLPPDRRKLSDALNEKQRSVLMMNLLQEMRREGTICHEGPKRGGRWVLANAPPEAVASSQKTEAASQDPGREPPIPSRN